MNLCFWNCIQRLFHSGKKGFFEGCKYCSVLMFVQYCPYCSFFLLYFFLGCSLYGCIIIFWGSYVFCCICTICHEYGHECDGMLKRLPLSPQWDVRTWKFVSAPQETPSSWSFWDPTSTPSLRATSWAMAAACSPNSSFGCLRTDSHMKQSLVRKSTDVQYVQLMHKERSDLKGLMTSSLLFLFA